MSELESVLPKKNALIRIVSFTDPYCTWCWGSEPILRKIQYLYADQIEISFIMGGLVKDANTFFDQSNNIGGPGMMEQVGSHWLEASERHGMPVSSQIWGKDSDFDSTYPANIAFKAAQNSNPELAKNYLRRIREAAASEGKYIHKREVLLELADNIGINMAKFVEVLDNGVAEKLFYKDLDFARSLQVKGFPTFFIEPPEGRCIFLYGYKSFASFVSSFKQLVGDTIIPKSIELNNETILDFIRFFKRVATAEVAELFGIPKNDAYRVLKNLELNKQITMQKVGNGEFWIQSLGPDV